ncbi:hypothetical protein K8R43_02355, partial [archaeon]|nr:hypothetical protein [archaeon]
GKHLHQFQLLEFEHEGDLESLLGNIENTVQAMIKLVLENDREHLEQLGRDVKHLESYLKPFNRMTYSQAVQTLWGTPTEVRWGDDLGPAQEQALMDIQGNTPLFITHYPKDIKFFNMRVNDSDQEVVNSADLILPYSGESAGSAERENDHERLKDRFKVSQMYRVLKQRGVSLKEFSDYIKLIEKNPVLHSGCGIGFTRVSQSVLGFNDIRMTTNYPINKESLY